MNPKFRAWDSVKKEMFKDTFAITKSGQVVINKNKAIADFPKIGLIRKQLKGLLK